VDPGATIGVSVLALDRHPEQKAWLLADPGERMERAVEELARFMSSEIVKWRDIITKAGITAQ